jgi:hypothetical protein
VGNDWGALIGPTSGPSGVWQWFEWDSGAICSDCILATFLPTVCYLTVCRKNGTTVVKAAAFYLSPNFHIFLSV